MERGSLAKYVENFWSFLEFGIKEGVQWRGGGLI